MIDYCRYSLLIESISRPQSLIFSHFEGISDFQRVKSLHSVLVPRRSHYPQSEEAKTEFQSDRDQTEAVFVPKAPVLMDSCQSFIDVES